MKNLIVCMLVLIPLHIVKGQDRIITVRHDTIFCRIISISSDRMLYEQKEDGHVVGKFIPTEQVLEYLQTARSSEHSSRERTNRERSKPPHRWLIGLYPGGASMLGSTTNSENRMIEMGIPKSQVVDYSKKFKQGWSINGDMYYMLTDRFGLGAKYSLFTSSVRKDLTVALRFSTFSEFVFMDMKEIQYIHHIGPSAIFRTWLDQNRKFQLVAMLSAGYVQYRGELRINPNQHTLFHEWDNSYGRAIPIYNFLNESRTWGADIGLSGEYFLNPQLSIGASTRFMYARLKKFDVSTKHSKQSVELDKKDYQSVARLDYSFSFRFHF